MTSPTLFALVGLPFVAALLVAVFPEHLRRAAAWSAGLVAAAAIAVLFAHSPAVFDGVIVSAAVQWLPGLGVSFGFRLDGLAFVFALLILAIGVLVVLYAHYYLSAADSAPRFFAFLLLFMGSMLGVVLADNLVLLVVFWELTSLSSFLLIGFWRQEAEARQGARMALTVTGAGGLCLLAGVLLLGRIAGSYDLDAVLAAAPRIHADPLYVPVLVLILLGAFTKSAQFPFHFWLPHAMAAPTPVSAYLHSATMVKAGVFLLARLYPALGGSEPWFFIVSAVGLATLLAGAYIAVFQHDLKGLLAYSTISHLGLITLLFGLDSPLAVVAGVFHILNHAVFKASLFMATGIIDHECGTRDMRRINGLWKVMPYTATLAMTAAAAMAGVPLMNGFLSKEMFFAETLALEGHQAVEFATPVIATLAGMFSVAYSARFIHDVFFNGEPAGLPRQPHEPARWMKVPVEILVATCFVVGLAPAYTVGPLLALGARAALGTELPEYSLAIWHGFNLPLLMSMLATAGGLAFYFSLQKLFRLHDIVHLPRGGKEMFDWTINKLHRGAGRIMRLLDNGSLRRYLLLLVLVAIAAVGVPLLVGGVERGARQLTAPTVAELLMWGLGIAATLGAVFNYRKRLAALIFLGAAGLIVTLTFVYFSAPDLALTQLLVEVVSIILMMLALHYLPPESPPEPNRARLMRDALIAGLAGLGAAAAVWGVLTRPFDSVSGFYLEKTVSEGGGTNAVNVIIVDFRGFDTLGEITVLAIAGLVIVGLLRDIVAAPAETPREPSLLLQTATRLLLPLAVMVTVFLFLRGHNLPGGGFIAGLVLASALLVQYVASGARWVDARLNTSWPAWIGVGLLTAGLTGVGSWWFAHPFLTSSFVHPVWPLIGEVPIASAMFFDLGVFLTVVGATMLALTMLGRLNSERGAN